MKLFHIQVAIERTFLRWLCGIIGLFMATVLPAETVVFGGEVGWDNAVMSDLRKTTGWQDKDALTLISEIYRSSHTKYFPLTTNPMGTLDILLRSEQSGISNPVVNYSLEGNGKPMKLTSARGGTAIWAMPGGLKLNPSKNAMFAPGKEWGSFTLGINLCPQRLKDGETLFFWEGLDSQTGAQSIVAIFNNRRLVWKFIGFFRRDSNRTLNLEIASIPLIPDEWRYHQIAFYAQGSKNTRTGASPGLLEYRLDGIPVDSVHASSNGSESRQIFHPRIGNMSDKALRIASDYTGWFDEFTLESTAGTNYHSDQSFPNQNGSQGLGRLPFVDSGFVGSSFTEIRSRAVVPETTRIRYFVQAVNTVAETDNIGLPNPTDPLWVEIPMKAQTSDQMGSGRWYVGSPTTPVRGRYFTIGFLLQSDMASNQLPSLSLLELDYFPRLPPEPPRDPTIVTRHDNVLAITWNPNAEADVTGWWVFWGPRPGDYFSGTADDPRYGMVWIPRNTESDEPPQFKLPVIMAGNPIYASVRAAWPESGPENFLETPIISGPQDYKGLSKPSRELTLFP